MIVIRLSKKKKNKNFYYINVFFRKKSIYGKIINRIGIFNSNINYGKKFFIDFKLLLFYIKNGAKLSKKVFNLIKI